MSTLAKSLDLQLEGVDKKLPVALECANILWSKIKASEDVKRVSSKSYRVPMYLNPGQRFAYVNRDGGSYPRGGAGLIDEATVSTVSLMGAVEINDSADIFTDTTNKAVRSYWELELDRIVKETASDFDRQMNGGVNGQIGTVTSVASSPTINFNNNRGVQLFRVGMKIGFTDSGITTARGECSVTAVNRVAKTIIIDSLPAGTVATDLAFYEGLYPTAGAVSAATTLYTVPYLQQTSGTVLNISRTTYPELAPSNVDAASANLSIGNVRSLFAKMSRKRVGTTDIWADKDYFWYTEVAQEMAWAAIGDPQIQITTDPGSTRDAVDYVGRARTKCMGIPMVISPNADPSRMDLLKLSQFGRIEAEKFGFKRDKNGNMFWQVPNTSGANAGAPLAATEFFVSCVTQIFTYDSGENGSITALAVNY